MAALASLLSVIAGVLRRDSRVVALALILVSGSVVAVTSSKPQLVSAPRAVQGSGPLDRAQQRASHAIDELFGSDAPMARALLIADQHRIPPEMRDRYARAGMVHMLSISGLHVAIIAGAVMMFFLAVGLSRNAATVVSVALTLLYVAMIGMPPPAVRSGIMLAMVGASRIFQRPTSQWAALAVGAFVPLYEPRTVLDLGYQLSVTGIAGLIASGSLAKRLLRPRLDGWRMKVGRELLTSVVATIVTAPLIAWYFGRVSLVAPFANLAAGPVISILQPTLFLAVVLAPFKPVASVFAAASHPMLAVFDGIASAAASIPAASVSIIPTLTAAALGGAASAAFLTASISRYPARPMMCCACALALIVWAPVITPRYHGGMEMDVLDVGQGDAILVRTDRGRWIVFDAGRIWQSGDAGRSTIIPYIMQRGGEVEAFVLSHAHADHVGGAQSVLGALHPRYFWDSAFPQGSGVYESTLAAADRSGTQWLRVHAGDTMRVDGVRVTFLAPDSAWTAALGDPNEASTIALVEFGSTRFLLMGDAERAEEEWLLNHAAGDLDADVLKVGHHGSNTSSTDSFLAAVTPALALISVGADNLYGHPGADVLASLSRIGAVTVRTDQSGTIVVHSDGTHLSYEAGGQSWDISRR
jgi:competence protein ComEC